MSEATKRAESCRTGSRSRRRPSARPTRSSVRGERGALLAFDEPQPQVGARAVGRPPLPPHRHSCADVVVSHVTLKHATLRWSAHTAKGTVVSRVKALKASARPLRRSVAAPEAD